MSSADEIKRLFKDAELSVDPDADEKVFDDVLQARQTVIKKVPASPEIWRILMKNPFTKFAVAAVILCVFGLLILFGNGNTLYAQVIEAIENANTIHAVTESLNDGKWEKDTEVWYEHGKGVVETGWGNGDKTFVRIDNGQYMWEYHAGNNYARRSKTINPMGVTKKLLNTDSFKEQATRESGQDKAVDGVRYMAYIQSNPESTWRNLIWLDEINRVILFSKSLWQITHFKIGFVLHFYPPPSRLEG